MTTRQTLTLILVLLSLSFALPATATPVENRLENLEERLGSRGSGQLFQYGKGVLRLEENLRKDEYLYLGRFIRNQILAPWREVEAAFLMELAQNPPSQLTYQQRTRLRWNTARVNQVTQRLRRVRRLVTRAANLNKENQRRERELTRIFQQWEKNYAVLLNENSEAAAAHAAWRDQSFLPAFEGLRSRDEQLRQRFDRLSAWSDEGNLGLWLRQVADVAVAVEQLNRRFP